MAQLAIKGHPTRGREVIEILEMLGGEDEYKFRGHNEECAYFEKNGVIYNTSPIGFNNIKLFTLEEFLEKFPYKVGDKVVYKPKPNQIFTIEKAHWDGCEIAYVIGNENEVIIHTYAKELQPYKEETMEEKTYPPYMDYDVKTMKKEILPYFLTVYDSEENKHEIVATDGYEIKEENGKYYAVKKQYKYPKTYEECCDVIGLHQLELPIALGYKAEIIETLQQLLICRDAYWKIAGEQMGLDKPWEPDWLNVEQDKYVLFTHDNAICSNRYVLGHNILAFPTEEMRDAFYENFKELIEACKELL